jgi:hypothetical protein
VRMSSNDVIKLYEIVGLGAQVTIVDAPLANIVPDLASIKRAGAFGTRL